MPEPAVRIAVDIGGTFTDIVLSIGELSHTGKILTTPQRPEEALLTGMRQLLQGNGLHLSDVDVFVHGTTLATNALIERRGARTALIATDGFRDVLEIGTESRYDQYDLTIEKPRPLVPRPLRFTVPERMDARGQVRRELDRDAVRALVPSLRDAGVESVAIAFLHGYANPRHEREAAAILAEALPTLHVTLASDVCPEIREYERSSTAVANAYVQPLMASYLSRMEVALQRDGFRGTVYLVTSSGALTSVATARCFPVRLVESGPAGGAIFSCKVARQAREDRVLSFDMGGTTAKVCLVEDSRPASSRMFEVDRAARFLKGSGLPLRIPVIELVEIGAGGGSIAGVDSLQRVTIGPQSASSVPGPACYGRGGRRSTVTDADVVLGLIEADGFAGGSLPLKPDLARVALVSDVGMPLGLSAEMAAWAVFETVCETMAAAARAHGVERGASLGGRTMIAFGGAAPLHAARVAEKLGISKILVPKNAGVGSAMGFLAAPVAFETVRSHRIALDDIERDAVGELLEGMAREAHAVVRPGAGASELVERRGAYMRYVGQGHEIHVALPERRPCPGDAQATRAAFEKAYQALFGRFIRDAEIEILSWTVLVTTASPEEAPAPAMPDRRPAVTPHKTVLVFDGRTGGGVATPVFLRSMMPAGAAIEGPAVIQESETSTVVPSGFTARIDAFLSIVMMRQQP